MKLIGYLSFFLLLISCNKSGSDKVSIGQTIKMNELPSEVHLPAATWDLVEFKGSVLSFADVTIRFKEKNSGILKEKSTEVQFQRGGGGFDMASVLSGSKGTFFVQFDFPYFENAKERKVLFVSRSQRRKLDQEIVGAGCNQFFDITDKFIKEMSYEGLKLNTSAFRHLSVVGGHFILAAKENNITHIAQVTLFDSRAPQYSCED